MPAANKQEEIRHLIRDKGYDQKRAVAAAYSMERAGKFRGKKGRKKSKRKKSSRG
jgi:hypothetical protein